MSWFSKPVQSALTFLPSPISKQNSNSSLETEVKGHLSLWETSLIASDPGPLALGSPAIAHTFALARITFVWNFPGDDPWSLCQCCEASCLSPVPPLSAEEAKAQRRASWSRSHGSGAKPVLPALNLALSLPYPPLILDWRVEGLPASSRSVWQLYLASDLRRGGEVGSCQVEFLGLSGELSSLWRTQHWLPRGSPPGSIAGALAAWLGGS